ncbi:lycopene beta-cyclase CrtY [Porphyrobacter algicida]|uniref:Lycopene beta-cyclase CrtY n=1 Tax=Qipengyuania algicida TaxID=1836209 RepID=A0A845ABR0_9SPHN|nr:lycopene beta-cyclase CrtY [Qipengyuania algicida]
MTNGNPSDTATACDIAIVGGGLAGGLAALAIHRAHPGLRLRLFEAGAHLGGTHRWSWFDSDLLQPEAELLAEFSTTSWPLGTQVIFPGHRRELSAPYRSLASTDFDSTLRRLLPDDAIRCDAPVTRLDAQGVTLGDGQRITARAVIDCRDFPPSRTLTGGWQLFVGRHIRTAQQHGLDRPIIMDADLPQHGAYRFVYSLPLSPHDIFVEDTYYANQPELDRAALGDRIAAYCTARRWDGEILGEEHGVLPVLTGGDFPAYRGEVSTSGVALAGARGLFTHPLTSYTLPFAAANALAIAEAAQLPGCALAGLMDQRAAQHWHATQFYRLLGKMLFEAAEPEHRYRIFERFYRLPEPLIERFYAGCSTGRDRLRILSGKPPVPIHRAIAAMLGKGAPLVQEDAQ